MSHKKHFPENRSLLWLSEEAACLPRGSVQRQLIEAQIARLRDEQAADCRDGALIETEQPRSSYTVRGGQLLGSR